MSVFPFIAAFLLVRHLQKSLKHTLIAAKWQSLLQVAQWSTIGVYLAAESLFPDVMVNLSGALLLAGMVYYIRQEPDFSPFRSFANAHIPLIAASILYGLILLLAYQVGFFKEYHEYFQGVVLAGFVWIFARSAASRKQQQALAIAANQNNQLELLVAERTAELTRQKDELQAALQELRTTQAQLVQSEKMASLGELTAGIAHEIQNPLNFVNNFSEVSQELMEELKAELDKGDVEEAGYLVTDVIDNLQKIHHHGRRADSIVKGMLEHSRASTGLKEPADINKLADEYLRLAYHGLRAKDKSFNAELITHFASPMPEVKIVAQDVGRVLLNLFTNAFYATQQKAKTAGPAYKPVVEVTTTMSTPPSGGRGALAVITVRDNGTGIPEEIKDKIMQPFFTTKPTGEGTGLGLSLSYDIVVKGHGGDIQINTREGEFTEFVITLPV